MAEHRNVDPGPGPTFAPVAVDVDGSGDEWQRIKVGYGPDGTPADVTTANPLPVVQTGTPALPTGAATSALQTAEATLVGAVNESAPGTDTASSGLNGRLQRIAQRLTSLLAVLPAALGQTTKAGSLSVTLASNQDALPITDNGGSLTVDGTVGISGTVPVSGTVTANAGTGPFPVSDNAGSLTVDAPVGTPAFVRLSDGSAAITTLPVSAASLPLPTGAALDATVGTTNTEIGGLTETAPATDTASSGLNGRVQRVAQRLTSLIALLPASLGQKTMANGLAVTIASDQSAVPVSGTVTATPTGTQAVSHAAATQADGHSANIGLLADAASASTLTGLLKNIKAALAGTLTISGAVTGSGNFATTSAAASQADGHSTAIGSTTDAASSTTGSVIGHLRKIRDVLVAGIPALVSGRIPVDGSGVTQPISGTVTATGTIATELATGLTPYSNTALSSTKQQVKVSAGKLHGWMVHNPNAVTIWIQVWDVASGSITVGTTAPTWTIPLPAGASANVMSEKGVAHATAINIAATLTATGAGAPATALTVSLFYV